MQEVLEPTTTSVVEIARGRFSPDQLALVRVSGNYTPDAQVAKHIDRGWAHATALMDERGHPYFNGELLRPERIVATDTTLAIEVSEKTTYRDVVGARALPETRLSFPYATLPQALSAIALVYTRDGSLVWRWRDDGDWPASYELPGGFVRRHETNLSDVILSHVAKNLEVDSSALQDLFLTAVVENQTICEIVLVFTLRLAMDAVELASSRADVFTVRDTADWEELQDGGLIHEPSRAIMEYALSVQGALGTTHIELCRQK